MSTDRSRAAAWDPRRPDRGPRRPAAAAARAMPLGRAVLAVFAPFAAAYYLSYLFRTINALSAARIGADLRLGAAELGLLTAVYFLTFAAMQLPVGVALDRHGPRRVQIALLPVAAAGSALFALAEGMPLLLLGRALVGLGAAACLVSGLKALVLSFPKERLALAKGCFVAVGALGAVTAAAPAELLLDGLGWRGLFLALAAAVAAAAGAVWLLAPRDPPDGAWAGTEGAAATAAAARLGDVFRDHRFWRVAPVSACCVGTAFALQGLWAGPWLADVALLDRASVVRGLLAMALGLCAGALLLGAAADRLGRRGVRPAEVLAAAAAAAMVAQLALVLRAPVPPEALWALIGASGGATVLGFAALADIFPKASAGRANGAPNLLHIGAAFLVQGGIGLVVGLWPADAFGRYPAEAYAAALGLNLVPQAAALAWFLLAPRLARAAGLGGAAWGRAAALDPAPPRSP